MAADKNCIPMNTHKSRFSKSTEGLNRKISLSKDYSKHRAAKYLLPFVRTF